MDTQTLGAAIAIVKKIPGSAAAEAIAAAARAEAAAESVDTGLTMQNGKLCVKVERG